MTHCWGYLWSPTTYITCIKINSHNCVYYNWHIVPGKRPVYWQWYFNEAWQVIFEQWYNQMQTILTNKICTSYRPDSIDLLFLWSSCTLIIKKSCEKNHETEIFVVEINTLSNKCASSCNFCLTFLLFLFLYSFWNGSGKDQRNNTSIKSGLNTHLVCAKTYSYNFQINVIWCLKK